MLTLRIVYLSNGLINKIKDKMSVTLFFPWFCHDNRKYSDIIFSEEAT